MVNDTHTRSFRSEAVACTVVTHNYISYARALATSFHQFHPNMDFVVLFVEDENTNGIDSSEPFIPIFASELSNIPSKEHFFAKYDALELTIAIKPFFFEYLLVNTNVKKLIFFDSDCLLFSDLQKVFDRLEDNLLVLTPHILEPAQENTRPNDIDFLRLGVFNLGFIGISKTGAWQAFLQWWKSKLYSNCIKRQERGIFLDQKFLDLAPCFFDKIFVLREPGYNVAWWNLNQRKITSSSKQHYQVNGQPLVFFHYSGFKVGYPDTVTRHLKHIRFGNLETDIVNLYQYYEEMLLNSGYQQTITQPYQYSSFPDGVVFPYILRVCLRENDSDGKVWTNPWLTFKDDRSFRWWALTSQFEGELPPLLKTISHSYVEIQEAFDLRKKDDRLKFMYWVTTNASALELPEFYAASLAQLIENQLVPSGGTDVEIRSIPLTERCECGRIKPGVFA